MTIEEWQWIPAVCDHFSESSHSTSLPHTPLAVACKSWSWWAIAESDEDDADDIDADDNDADEDDSDEDEDDADEDDSGDDDNDLKHLSCGAALRRPVVSV